MRYGLGEEDLAQYGEEKGSEETQEGIRREGGYKKGRRVWGRERGREGTEEEG